MQYPLPKRGGHDIAYFRTVVNLSPVWIDLNQRSPDK